MLHTKQSIDAQRGVGRPRGFDLQEALDKAIVVFSERGFQAATISELTTAMSLTAGSVYKAFGDKRGVFLAAMDHYKSLSNKRRDARIAHARTGRQRVRALLEYYAENSHGESGQRGCLVVGAAVELALFDDDAAGKVATHQRHTQMLLETSIAQGQSDGSIGSHIDAASAARALFCFMQGIRIAGKTGLNRDDALAAADAATKILD